MLISRYGLSYVNVYVKWAVAMKGGLLLDLRVNRSPI